MNPFVPLKYQKPLMDLKEKIAAEGSKAVFSPLIVKYILNNPHRVTVEMQVRILDLYILKFFVIYVIFVGTEHWKCFFLVWIA